MISAPDLANGWLLLDTIFLLCVSFRLSWCNIHDLTQLNDAQRARQRRSLPVYRLAMGGAFLTMLLGLAHVIARNLVAAGPVITYVALGYAALVLLGLIWFMVAKPDRE